MWPVFVIRIREIFYLRLIATLIIIRNMICNVVGECFTKSIIRLCFSNF